MALLLSPRAEAKGLWFILFLFIKCRAVYFFYHMGLACNNKSYIPPGKRRQPSFLHRFHVQSS